MSTTITVRALPRNEHHTVPFIASGDQQNGNIVAIGDGRIGVVCGLETVLSTEVGAAQVLGQFDLLKNATSDTYSVGDPVWWDATNNKAKTAYAAGYLYAGRCMIAAVSGGTYVYTDLNVASGGGGAGTTLPPVSLTAASVTIDSSFYGRTMLLSSPANAAQTVALPAATGTGAVLRFIVGVVNTGGVTISTTPSTDVFQGQIIAASTAETPDLSQPWVTASNSNTIILNGTTKGGVSIGDMLELRDIASAKWALIGFVTASGTEATPLSHV